MRGGLEGLDVDGGLEGGMGAGEVTTLGEIVGVGPPVRGTSDALGGDRPPVLQRGMGAFAGQADEPVG